MPGYTSYPKEKDTPSRKSRKSARNKVFQTNKALGPKLRKARRVAKREALEAALELENQEVETTEE